MEDVNLDYERDCNWRMMFEDNGGGVDDKKTFLHAKMWDLYVNEKGKLVKGGYLVEVIGHHGKKVLWDVLENHVVEEATDHGRVPQKNVTKTDIYWGSYRIHIFFFLTPLWIFVACLEIVFFVNNNIFVCILNTVEVRGLFLS